MVPSFNGIGDEKMTTLRADLEANRALRARKAMLSDCSRTTRANREPDASPNKNAPLARSDWRVLQRFWRVRPMQTLPLGCKIDRMNTTQTRAYAAQSANFCGEHQRSLRAPAQAGGEVPLR